MQGGICRAEVNASQQATQSEQGAEFRQPQAAAAGQQVRNKKEGAEAA